MSLLIGAGLVLVGVVLGLYAALVWLLKGMTGK